MTPDFLRASINGNLAEAARILRVSLPVSWPDIVSIAKMRLTQLEDDPALLPWLLRAIILRDSGAMIGHIGFHTAPGPDYLLPWSPFALEFGLTVFAPERRQGYAREASLALMQWAHDRYGVADFIVSVARENVASRALVAGLGFHSVGTHLDEADGLEDLYLKRIASVA